MLPDEPAENEPEEPDLGPAVPDAADAPADLHHDFWVLVATFNVALFALSLGAMFVGFRGRWDVGGALVLGGAIAFLAGVYRYRRVQRRLARND